MCAIFIINPIKRSPNAIPPVTKTQYYYKTHQSRTVSIPSRGAAARISVSPDENETESYVTKVDTTNVGPRRHARRPRGGEEDDEFDERFEPKTFFRAGRRGKWLSNDQILKDFIATCRSAVHQVPAREDSHRQARIRRSSSRHLFILCIYSHTPRIISISGRDSAADDLQWPTNITHSLRARNTLQQEAPFHSSKRTSLIYRSSGQHEELFSRTRVSAQVQDHRS
jgi:hypothetical protein